MLCHAPCYHRTQCDDATLWDVRFSKSRNQIFLSWLYFRFGEFLQWSSNEIDCCYIVETRISLRYFQREKETKRWKKCNEVSRVLRVEVFIAFSLLSCLFLVHWFCAIRVCIAQKPHKLITAESLWVWYVYVFFVLFFSIPSVSTAEIPLNTVLYILYIQLIFYIYFFIFF